MQPWPDRWDDGLPIVRLPQSILEAPPRVRATTLEATERKSTDALDSSWSTFSLGCARHPKREPNGSTCGEPRPVACSHGSPTSSLESGSLLSARKNASSLRPNPPKTITAYPIDTNED